ncbi:MAG TPA: transcriptional repressor LexA [Gemmatimonadaceae bacterium]|nr:transcriptional repressor LexA [Gemmatimonadaceae bacterium]
MTDPLSNLERRVYHYLIDFLAEHTYQPSIREIAKKFRIKSTKTVSDLLQSLARKGYIERDRARSRGVRLLGYSGATMVQPVPYYGKIHAGEPALLPEHRQSFITMDRRFLPSEDTFFLKVKGDSMVQRGIVEGDYVMVSPSEPARDGDIIAARLGEEATVKTLTHQGSTVVLEPANPDERAIEVKPSDDFAVLGVVTGIFRPFHEREIAKESPELD